MMQGQCAAKRNRPGRCPRGGRPAKMNRETWYHKRRTNVSTGLTPCGNRKKTGVGTSRTRKNVTCSHVSLRGLKPLAERQTSGNPRENRPEKTDRAIMNATAPLRGPSIEFTEKGREKNTTKEGRGRPRTRTKIAD